MFQSTPRTAWVAVGLAALIPLTACKGSSSGGVTPLKGKPTATPKATPLPNDPFVPPVDPVGPDVPTPPSDPSTPPSSPGATSTLPDEVKAAFYITTLKSEAGAKPRYGFFSRKMIPLNGYCSPEMVLKTAPGTANRELLLGFHTPFFAPGTKCALGGLVDKKDLVGAISAHAAKNGYTAVMDAAVKVKSIEMKSELFPDLACQFTQVNFPEYDLQHPFELKCALSGPGLSKLQETAGKGLGKAFTGQVNFFVLDTPADSKDFFWTAELSLEKVKTKAGEDWSGTTVLPTLEEVVVTTLP